MSDGFTDRYRNSRDTSWCVEYSIKMNGTVGVDAEVVEAHDEEDASMEFVAVTGIDPYRITKIIPLDNVRNNA